MHMFALMNHARLGVAAQALGIIESVSADARAYAVAREQFGKPIAKHSAVKQMLANMQVTSELVRGVIYKTAFAVDMERALREKLSGDVGASERFMLERDLKSYANQAALLTPLIKFYAAEKAVEIARDGVQVHGGNGYTTEYDTDHLRGHERDPSVIVPEGHAQGKARPSARESGSRRAAFRR